MSNSIATRISFLVVSLVLVSSLLVGAASYWFFRGNAISSHAERARDIAQSAAAAVDVESFESVMASLEKNDQWYATKAILDEIKTNTGVMYLYVLGAEIGDTVTYYAEGSNLHASSPDEALELGYQDAAEDYGDDLPRALRTGTPLTTEVYSSGDYGMLVSGYAPVFFHGRVIGVVGADISVDEVMAQVNQFALRVALIVAALCVLFGLVSIRMVSVSLGRPIRELTRISDRLAEGDADVQVTITRRDEIGLLADSFRRMVQSTKIQVALMEELAEGNLTITPTVRGEKDAMNLAIAKTVQKLSGLLEHILSSAVQVTAAAGQISDTAQALAASSGQQAETVSRLSEAMSAVQTESEENATQAASAQESTQTAEERITQSGRLMDEMTGAMTEINQSSREISQIIKTIDDIAFQTNILALNAAVEAARAGQHGKGFAVVADEVRNLATKSAAAAKETSTLIASSGKKVSDGNNITAATQKSLGQVSAASAATVAAIRRISQASLHQKTSLTEIRGAMDQIAQMVQSTSATAEEYAASAQELAAQAHMLEAIVAQFRLPSASHQGR